MRIKLNNVIFAVSFIKSYFCCY